MKPNWKDAPEWANYLAMGEDGKWAWFDNEPFIGFDTWLVYGRIEEVQPIGWEQSLEKRPE